MSLLNYTALSELARDLGHLAGPDTIANVEKAVEVTARRTKDGWNAALYREGHAALTGRSISYDVGVARDFALWQTDAMHGRDSATIVGEIGPRRGAGKQAGVVRLLENGSAHTRPHGYGSGVLQQNEADFEHGLDLALRTVERRAGL